MLPGGGGINGIGGGMPDGGMGGGGIDGVVVAVGGAIECGGGIGLGIDGTITHIQQKMQQISLTYYLLHYLITLFAWGHGATS